MKKICICFLFITSGLLSQENKLYISSIYGTSTDIPIEKNSIFNCFDLSTNTSWNTIQGSCEEEGIMIKLDKPSFVSEIAILGANGKKDISFDLYIDGASYGGSNIGKEILNIFIKSNGCDNGKSFSISEIDFYDATNQPYKVIVPEKVITTVNATSELKPKVAYGAINLIDGQKENGWAEGDTSSGIGQEVNFKFDRKIHITDLSLWNGYHRSIKHYSANAKAKKILIKDTSTGYTETHVLSNEMKAQKINLATPLFTNALSIKILEIYEGTKYKDLVISEIQLLNKGTYYSMQSKEFTKRIEDNLEKSKNNPIFSKILDKNISFRDNSTTKEGKYKKYTNNSRSILLRSNNTFVWYQNEYENIVDTTDEEDEMGTDISKQIIADGSWYIVEESSSHMKIKIFGKMFEPRDYSDIYKGDVTNNTLRIFHDYLTISKDKVLGEKIFETIPF